MQVAVFRAQCEVIFDIKFRQLPAFVQPNDIDGLTAKVFLPIEEKFMCFFEFNEM